MIRTDLSTLPAPSAARRHDLDWLRVFAFGMLILYHVGMFYVTWPWHVKSPASSPWPEPAMLLVNPWRLALLFFISGVAIRFATDRMPLRSFLKGRFARLFVPLVFGMFVVVVPQAYVEMRFKGEVGPGFLAFWRDYALLRLDLPIITPTWNHLWYVAYMLVYTLLLAPFLPLLRRLADGPAARLARRMASAPAVWLLVLPALPFLLYRLLLDPVFPTTHALVDDWANHAHCATMLLFGYVVARSDAFWRSVGNALPAASVTAVGLGAMLLAARLAWQNGFAGDALITAVHGARVFYAWAVILALLGLARRYLDRPGRALTYLNEAVFPYYILHQTAIVLAGYWLIPYRLPAALEATFVTLATVLACAAGFELVRRSPVLRVLFGLAPAGRRLAVPVPAAASGAGHSGSSKVTMETSPSSAP